MSSFFKTLCLFLKTFFYLLLSYKKNADFIELKQRWAQSLLLTLDLKLNVINKHSGKKKLILVGNHISFLDIIVLMAAEPRIVFLAKAEVANWPIIGSGAKRMQTIFVKRESISSRAVSKQLIYDRIKLSEKSTYIGGFPSGTTSLFENLPWKKGLFEIAMKTEIDVQCFKVNYFPLRECAYIDQDNLFSCLMNLFNTKNKMVTLEWGVSQRITNLNEQMMSIQSWTQIQHTL